jgi:RPA family protein
MATLFVPNPARRATIAEILESYYTFSGEGGDDGKAAKFSLLPTGERANSVFLIVTLTEVKTDDKFSVGTVNDKTGKIRIRASREYQPVAYNQLKDLTGNLPAHVAVTGGSTSMNPRRRRKAARTGLYQFSPKGLHR